MVLIPTVAFGAGEHPSIFHALQLEADVGEGRDYTIGSWDLDGWVGGDYHKLAIKSEGEVANSHSEQAEFWTMYSRNVAEFWDAQLGIRYDDTPVNEGYLVLGVEGLAKYFFETEAHLFVSAEGDVSVRVRQENELLITQRLILQPYIELEVFAQDVPEQDVAAGLATGEFGLQTRYEITRKFAPYFDLRYERSFSSTGRIAAREGERKEDFIAAVGLRLLF